MKTKNSFIGIAILILMLMLSGCEKSFLDKNPNDSISNQTFWNSESDMNMAVSGCYASLIGPGTGGESLMDYARAYLDGLTDVAHAHWGYYGIENMAMGIINPQSGGAPNNIYNYAYRTIAQCNNAMGNIDRVQNVSAEKLNVAKGEIRFIRALAYFDLVRCFGDVPLYKTSPKDAESAMVAKSPAADIYAFIHEDLDFAIANLPDVPYAGHAVKGSALGLKASVLITQENWAETVAVCQQIINSGVFSIYNNYPNMFIRAGQDNNPEIMFSIEYKYPVWHAGIVEYAKHIFLHTELRDAFECIDGLPITESPLYDSTGIKASMNTDETVPWKFRENRDPRFKYIVRGPHTDWKGQYAYNFFNPTGVQNRKFIDTTITSLSDLSVMDNDFPRIRYADVLLMYAEAKNEVSGPDQSVYNAINQVRSRPNVNPRVTIMPPVDQARYNTKDLVRNYIRHERFVEFPMEGIRYFDLKRWKILHIIMPTVKNPTGQYYVFPQKAYLWPFSQHEMDNNKNLVQTPGY